MELRDAARFLTLFSMPKPVRITGRSSSITNSFVNSIIPVVHPTPADIRAALDVLGMGQHVSCAYCGDDSTEWDHLRPLVRGRRPTGYISEIQNLVPACGKCNQSKGNKHWRDWMLSAAPRSPNTRGVVGTHERVQRLTAFEQWREPTHVDFESVISDELWAQHWENHTAVLSVMRAAGPVAAQIREQIALLADKRA